MPESRLSLGGVRISLEHLVPETVGGIVEGHGCQPKVPTGQIWGKLSIVMNYKSLKK